MTCMTASKTLFRQLEASEKRCNENLNAARYSSLNWKYDLVPRLKEITNTFLSQNLVHKFFAEENANTFQFEVRALSRFHPSKINGGIDFERPSSLVFSMHSNGTVVVIVYPHAVENSSFGTDKGYILAAYNSCNDLAGVQGNARILKHILCFLKVTEASFAFTTANKTTAHLIRKLQKKNDFYKRNYESNADRKRVLLNTEIGLGTGLVAGLFAGSLMPLVVEIGERSAKALQTSEEPLSSEKYLYHSLMAELGSPGLLSILTILLALLTILVLRRRTNL